MPDKTPMPTNDQIDELAQLYTDAQEATRLAQEKQSDLAGQIIALIEQYGSIPRRATKSKRIEGDDYQCTLSKGHSVEVNGARVETFRQWMKERGLLRLFRKLFKRESVFVLRTDADVLVSTIASGADLDSAVVANLVALFHQSLSIKDTSPSLKVEAKDEKKKKRAEAAA